MKKIMFNDKYGLTQAVLDGRKTMTRRIVPQCILDAAKKYQEEYYAGALEHISLKDAIMNMVGPERMFQRYIYHIGEIVAIAQSYSTLGYSASEYCEIKMPNGGTRDGTLEELMGWSNKMYVNAERMINHIRITGFKVEYLQDISDEDCLREGITHVETGINHYGVRDTVIGTTYYFYTPRAAFAFLIDRVGKRGTWDSNPLVFAYECERVY